MAQFHVVFKVLQSLFQTFIATRKSAELIHRTVMQTQSQSHSDSVTVSGQSPKTDLEL